MGVFTRSLAALAVVAVTSAGAPPPVREATPAAGTPAPTPAAQVAVHYRAPVDARVVDGFRPPSNPYAAGNRGIDYGVAPGTPVRAAAAGVVVFAGHVGGSLAVTVLHADRVSTTYTGLEAVAVENGDTVAGGDAVGTTSSAFHFGARAGAGYLDPAVLLDDRPSGRVHLVPVTVR